MSQFETSMPQDAGYASAPAPRTSKLAVTALILSLVFCCPLTTIPGIVLGLVAMATTMGNPMKKGAGIALLAVLIGIGGTAFQVWGGKALWVNFMQPVFDGPKFALEAGFDNDPEAMRQAMYGQAATATDNEIAAFIAQLRNRYGKFQNAQLNDQAANRGGFGGAGQTSQEFPYFLTFANGTVECDVMMVFADEVTGQFVMKPSVITIRDADLGDLTFPAPTGGDGGADAEP